MTIAAPGVSLRVLLRRGFEPVHARVHRLGLVDRLAGGYATRDDLVRLLRALLACQKVYEAASRRLGVDDAVLHRTEALAHDVARLGANTVEPGTGPAGPRDHAGLVGWMYVLEGSRIGAGTLLDRLPDWAVASGATRYLALSVEGRAAADLVLERELARAAGLDPSLAAAVESACALGVWLCDALAPPPVAV